MILPEAAHLLARIEDLRGQIATIIQGLPLEALNWRPDAASDDHAMNSIAVLALHSAGAEHFWIGETIGQLPATRDRSAEFEAIITDPTTISRTLDKVAAQTRTILHALTQADLDGSRPARGQDVPVRWSLLHIVDHTALHLGHIQITTQLWQGGQAIDAPRWFQRLNK